MGRKAGLERAMSSAQRGNHSFSLSEHTQTEQQPGLCGADRQQGLVSSVGGCSRPEKVFGLGAVAHMVVGDRFGSYLGVNLGFGFGVTMGVHMAGNVSGAHMNAALTFTNCALGRMAWKKFPVYVLGQFLGSFLAAATIYCLFYPAIIDYSGGHLTVTGPTATANIFATYLPDHMTLWRGFLDEVLVTGMLQLCLFAITDKGNNPALQGTQALVIGILILIIGVSLGMNTGYAINPSRDLPPRFFTFIAGWGVQVFSLMALLFLQGAWCFSTTELLQCLLTLPGMFFLQSVLWPVQDLSKIGSRAFTQILQSGRLLSSLRSCTQPPTARQAGTTVERSQPCQTSQTEFHR
ncbi:aquaporin-7 isoform X2 [Manis pentadactyla]|uniref:aquaporin-7 isoform X2 n=1 Tax=Manis pentadactyla TaxID=143292 RepID=UPI00255CBA83|nr:aquaporin-7 isoform X2 [Manis pentadactyla]